MTDKPLQDAFTSWNEMSLDSDGRLAYEVRLKQVLDQEAAVNEAKWKEEKAREEGIEKGKTGEKEHIARNLLLKKLDVEIVAETTGLSLERVQEMKAELELQ